MTYPIAYNYLSVARRLLSMGPMSRWLVVLVLAVVSATASAQPAAERTRITVKAQDTARTLERRLVALTAEWNQLARRYDDQKKEIDRLKKQRTSWRQQRELKDSLATANDTATKLTAVTNDLAKANTALATARRTLVAAIDAEITAGATGARATELAKLKAQLTPAVQKKRVARIVLPDMEIDPLADPEELEEQAAALRESETQLQNQIVGLDKQAKDLDEVAKLRKQHDRSAELSRRDDDQPQKTASQGGGGRAAFESTDSSPTAGAPPDASGNGGGGGGGGTGAGSLSGTPSFESEATVVLAEVIDSSTIETLHRAQRTGDPAQRALAAKKARDAVAKRLEQLKKKRAEIEAIAKSRTIKR